jgi:transposase-like protein
MRRGQP